MVYLSCNLALAVLEVLVHSPKYALLKEEYVYFTLKIADDFILKLDKNSLPEDWNSTTLTTSTQLIGDKWLKDKASLALLVPSRIIPVEQNILLNPRHSDFAEIKLSGPENFEFDNRL